MLFDAKPLIETDVVTKADMANMQIAKTLAIGMTKYGERKSLIANFDLNSPEQNGFEILINFEPVEHWMHFEDAVNYYNEL